MKNTKNKILLPSKFFSLIITLAAFSCTVLAFSGCGCSKPAYSSEFDIAALPKYSNEPYVEVNNNIPFFTDKDLTERSFETYGPLDKKGRCTVAYANIGKDLMPTTERGAIGSIKPSGWQNVKYNGIVDGNYLYNRCHLIGWQLTDENANRENLITGTRYLNIEGMLPFENMVAQYIEETDNHVLYRVTPVFEGDNLLASGVLIEAESVEDKGQGILFNVFCYNVQPHITIDYSDGSSSLNTSELKANVQMVWITKSGKKYHSSPSCSNMKNPSQVTLSEAESKGLTPCQKCY